MADQRTPPTYFGAPPRALRSGTSALARALVRARMFVGFAARTTRAWVRAARELVPLRVERRRLDRRRKALQYELGGAALDENEWRMQELRRQLHACIDECERNENAVHVALARARNKTLEERSATARTEIKPPA